MGLPVPQRVWIANVAGRALGEGLGKLLEGLWGQVPCFARAARECCGVRSGYREPHRLGVDRWLAMIGARGLSDGPCLVVDCGSAVTMDLLDGDGQQRDSVILPGFDAMSHALIGGTRLAEQGGQIELAEDSRDAMARGAQLALSAAAAQMRRAWSQQLGEDVALFLTGGDRGRLDARLVGPTREVAELVLDGLARVAANRDGQGGSG
jgi:type III pantothenate kinase